MKKVIYIALLCLAAHSNLSLYAFDLKSIVSGEYQTKKIPSFLPMSDGEHYTQVSDDKTMIIKYSYKTGKAVDTLFNVATARECPFKKLDGYSMSADEKKILLYADSEPIYRRSFKATYYTFEIKRNLVKPLSDKPGKQQIATFSPNGRMVAFVRDNNIYLKKLDYETESAVTTDGIKNKILNGVPDWVYEEEFSVVSTLSWAPDNTTLAFVKTNETDVPEYKIQLFEGECPSLTSYTYYPGEFVYKYPVAGTSNSKVAVYTYTVETRAVKKMNVPVDEDGYIPRIQFTQNPSQLAVMTFNRNQNDFKIFLTNPKSGVSKLLIQDKNETWIDPDIMNYVTFYPSGFIFASEKSGFRHLYHYNMSGTLIRQITHGNWDVTAYYGQDAKGNYYYESAEEGPLYRAVYRADAKGNRVKISNLKGYNQAYFNSACTYFINVYSSVSIPPVVTVNNAQGKQLRLIEENLKLKKLSLATKEFFTFKNETGETLNGYIMKPKNFVASKKYPLVMVQYSGPGSQMVLDKWAAVDWTQYLTDNGYVVACVDGRGTGGRGVAFSRSIYCKMGILEAQDQIAAARYLGSLSYIDANNIAIWGWSFGGYTTLMSMSMSSGVFKSGIAIAPVTDWRYYDTVYTERYMRTPQENNDGYIETSPLEKAASLDGKLLIISGTADDNVHYLNTLQYSEALVQANKQFEMQIYTNRNHSIYGCNTRLHLYTRIYDFIQRTLK